MIMDRDTRKAFAKGAAKAEADRDARSLERIATALEAIARALEPEKVSGPNSAYLFGVSLSELLDSEAEKAAREDGSQR